MGDLGGGGRPLPGGDAGELGEDGEEGEDEGELDILMMGGTSALWDLEEPRGEGERDLLDRLDAKEPLLERGI